MFRFIFLAMLFAVACAAPFQSELDYHWEKFKFVFRKKYSLQEEGARRLIWEQNVAKVVRHNLDADLGTHSYKLAINPFADMTNEEFSRMMNGHRRLNKTSKAIGTFMPPSHVFFPKAVDWRKEGLVTGVKNQGECGSCWAFSTTGSLEGQHKKKTGKLISLSEQNLLDCSGGEGNEGCNGGLMDNAFEYIKENKGIDTENSYPYLAVKQNKCEFKKSAVGATVAGYIDVERFNEDALLKAVATIGPISVAIDASDDEFQLYSGGIYDSKKCSSTDLNHGVLIVGYGTSNEQDYWIVKNSWGTCWGEAGYIRMSRNKNNQCGIASGPSYPVV